MRQVSHDDHRDKDREFSSLGDRGKMWINNLFIFDIVDSFDSGLFSILRVSFQSNVPMVYLV